jgi:hypothetical protein
MEHNFISVFPQYCEDPVEKNINKILHIYKSQ